MTDDRNERFLALLKPIQADCERWAYRLAGNRDDAQEILAQAVLNGLIHLDQLKDQSLFKWWMFKIIRTTFDMSLRAGKRRPDPVAPEDMSAWVGSRDEQALDRVSQFHWSTSSNKVLGV